MVFSSHHCNPCELMFAFGGLFWDISIIRLTIFSKSLMDSYYFRGEIQGGWLSGFDIWSLDKILIKSYLFGGILVLMII